MKLYARDEIDETDELVKKLLGSTAEDHGGEYPYIYAGLYPSAEGTACYCWHIM